MMMMMMMMIDDDDDDDDDPQFAICCYWVLMRKTMLKHQLGIHSRKATEGAVGSKHPLLSFC